MQIPLLTTKQRVSSIDVLRGLVMVVMALDHVRDYFGRSTIDPLDIERTTAGLYLTRWVTHICAPTFILLSGVSAFLSLSKKANRKDAAFTLFKRGLWLIVLEFTVINIGWSFDLSFHFIGVQVIWAIGWSMLFLSLLVSLRLKPQVIGIIGLLIIFGHNALDGIKAETLGSFKPFWILLHQQAPIQAGNYGMFVVYPIIPWIGVMAVGYYLGISFKLKTEVRQKLFTSVGICSLLLFVFLRYFNIYGDPIAWRHQANLSNDLMAIMNVAKYPPSLLYLLATLGIAMILLASLEHVNTWWSSIFSVYGRVPLFYYILHLYLIHSAQVAVALLMGINLRQLSSVAVSSVQWGFSLPVVYLVWILIVAALYLPCRWFMRVKQRRQDWWLAYL